MSKRKQVDKKTEEPVDEKAKRSKTGDEPKDGAPAAAAASAPKPSPPFPLTAPGAQKALIAADQLMKDARVIFDSEIKAGRKWTETFPAPSSLLQQPEVRIGRTTFHADVFYGKDGPILDWRKSRSFMLSELDESEQEAVVHSFPAAAAAMARTYDFWNAPAVGTAAPAEKPRAPVKTAAMARAEAFWNAPAAAAGAAQANTGAPAAAKVKKPTVTHYARLTELNSWEREEWHRWYPIESTAQFNAWTKLSNHMIPFNRANRELAWTKVQQALVDYNLQATAMSEALLRPKDNKEHKNADIFMMCRHQEIGEFGLPYIQPPQDVGIEVDITFVTRKEKRLETGRALPGISTADGCTGQLSIRRNDRSEFRRYHYNIGRATSYTDKHKEFGAVGADVLLAAIERIKTASDALDIFRKGREI